MEVFVNVDSAGELIDFLKVKAYNVHTVGETKDHKFAKISFDTVGQVGRPKKLPRKKIIELRKQGKSYSVIADELGIARSSVAVIAKDVVVEQKIILPKTANELEKLIESLHAQITRDTNIKDKRLHEKTLKLAKEKLSNCKFKE